MNFICSICSELLTPLDNIFSTLCGHIFHYSCLSKWISRSKSCPQCRNSITKDHIQRLYFTLVENESITKNSPLASLQEKVDNLKFQLLLKDKDVTRHKSKAISSDKQASSLRSEVRKLENKVDEKNAIIHALQQQIDCLKQIGHSSVKQAEINRLKKKLEELRNIQAILHDSAEGVQDILVNVTNPRVLAQYITCMKKELQNKQEKQKDSQQTIDRLRIEIANQRVQNDKLDEERMKRRKLQEKFAICESEKMYYQQKLKDLGLDTGPDLLFVGDDSTLLSDSSRSNKEVGKSSEKAETSATSISICEEVSSTNYKNEDVHLPEEAAKGSTKKSKLSSEDLRRKAQTDSTIADLTKNQKKLRPNLKDNRIEKNLRKKSTEENYSRNCSTIDLTSS